MCERGGERGGRSVTHIYAGRREKGDVEESDQIGPRVETNSFVTMCVREREREKLTRRQ